MPALEALLSRFRAAHTQPLGLSVDSVFSHANWGKSLGGVSFPLLADFHPKGQVADSFGMYLADKGISDRSTVVIDADGVVQHASSATPAGKRDMEELAAICEKIDQAYSGSLANAPGAEGLESGAKLYIKSHCGASRAAMLARDNLHLTAALPEHNISTDAAVQQELAAKAGKDQAPALIIGDRVIQESADIIAHLVGKAAPL